MHLCRMRLDFTSYRTAGAFANATGSGMEMCPVRLHLATDVVEKVLIGHRFPMVAWK